MKERLTKKDNVPFTLVENKLLNNNLLSWKAKGLWSYLYSKPDTWDFSSERIANDCSDGVDSTKSGLQELEEFGLLERKKRSDGRVDYIISWKPKAENPSKGKSLKGKSPRLINKDLVTNKEEDNNITVANATPVLFVPNPKSDSFFGKAKDKKLSNGLSVEAIPMSLEQFVLMCRGSAYRHIRLIGEYADERELNYTTRGQWREFGNRNLQVARRLAPYSDKQLEKAIELLEKDLKSDRNPRGFLSKWTMETIEKYIEQV